MSTGRDALELILDDAAARRAARSIDREFAGLGERLSDVARRFDADWGRAAANVERVMRRTNQTTHTGLIEAAALARRARDAHIQYHSDAERAARRHNAELTRTGREMQANARRLQEAEQRQAELTKRRIAEEQQVERFLATRHRGGGLGLRQGVGQGVGDYLAFGGAAGATFFALSAAESFGRESIQAAIEGSRAAAFLETSMRRAGISAEVAAEQVARLRREYGLSRTDTERALAGATRGGVLAGRPELGDDLLRATLNLTAAAGVERSRAAELLQSVVRGEDEALDLLLGRGPNALYREEARRTGRRESSFSDQEKLLIRINALLREGGEAYEANARYMASTAGSAERLAASFADIKRGTGEIGTDPQNLRFFANTLTFGIFEETRVRDSKGRATTLGQGIFGGPVDASPVEQGLHYFQQGLRFFTNALVQVTGEINLRAAEQAREPFRLAGVLNRAALAEDTGPFAGIRFAGEARAEAIRKAFEERAKAIREQYDYDPSYAGQLVGRAESERDLLLQLSRHREFTDAYQATEEQNRRAREEAERTRRTLERGVSVLNLQAEQNPVLRALEQTRQEAERITEEFRAWGPAGEQAAERAGAALAKIRERTLADAITEQRGRVQQIEYILNDLELPGPTTTYRQTGFRRGFYGQETGEPIFEAVRTPARTLTATERAHRAIAQANILEQDLLRAGISASEAQRRRDLQILSTVSADAVRGTVFDEARFREAAEREYKRRVAELAEGIKRAEEEKETKSQRDARLTEEKAIRENQAKFWKALAEGKVDLGTLAENLKNLKAAVSVFINSDEPVETQVIDGEASSLINRN